jgi:transketolase
LRNTFATELLNAARLDPRIVLVSGDLGFGVFDEFRAELPQQFVNAGVAEQAMMSMAAGLSSQGLRPFVYSIANFPSFRCLEQIRNDVAYMKNRVTIVSVGAGMGYGAHGYSHHAIEDLAIIRIFKEIEIYSPSDQHETIYCMRKILESSAPSYLRLGKGGEVNLRESYGFQHTDRGLDIGVAGIAVFWTGGIGSEVLEAIQELEQEGVKVFAMSFPEISRDLISGALDSIANLPVLTVEEHVLEGGFGSAVLEVASDNAYTGRITRLGINSQNKHALGSQSFLRVINGLDALSIAKKLREMAED